MKFTRKSILKKLEENKKYTGTISDIEHTRKGSYYDVKIKIPARIISIWVSDTITPEHPLFSIFDELIENEEDAENFDEKEIIGIEIEFTVKNIIINKDDGSQFERSFFNAVTPLFEYEESEEEDVEE